MLVALRSAGARFGGVGATSFGAEKVGEGGRNGALLRQPHGAAGRRERRAVSDERITALLPSVRGVRRTVGRRVAQRCAALGCSPVLHGEAGKCARQVEPLGARSAETESVRGRFVLPGVLPRRVDRPVDPVVRAMSGGVQVVREAGQF